MENESPELLGQGAFVSRLPGEGVRRRAGSCTVRSTEKRKHKSGSTAFLLVRIGICALLLCCALALKLSGGNDALAVMGVRSSDEEAGEDDTLGQLKFVELPSIIDVFAPSDYAAVPVASARTEAANEGFELIMHASVGESVISPSEGTVRSVSEDGALGRCVSVAGPDDTEFVIYGFETVEVEKGQPVKIRQKLGEAGGDITVRVYRAGRPVDAASVFGIADAG